MTTQDNEVFELCKSVYEKTGWEVSEYPSDWFMVQRVEGRAALAKSHPLYTSDYLLEKLPPGIYVSKAKNHYSASTGNMPAFYGKVAPLTFSADTPLKALLKLTLALHEAGELK